MIIAGINAVSEMWAEQENKLDVILIHVWKIS